MPLAVVGLSHRTAPVEVRERFVFDAARTAEVLERLVGSGDAVEAALLSTCNRTELYLVLPRPAAASPAGSGAGSGVGAGDGGDAGARGGRDRGDGLWRHRGDAPEGDADASEGNADAPEGDADGADADAAGEPAVTGGRRHAPAPEPSGRKAAEPEPDGRGGTGSVVERARAVATRVLVERGGGEVGVGRYLYAYGGRAAAKHLFRVVTSLDSMVVGEAQIQGQVKAAYETAASTGDGRVVGPVLSRLFETALSVGGEVRERTTLGVGAASVPSAAVELAKKIFGTLEGRRALVLGAGEMSALALECFAAEGIESVVVANRTAERASELAAKGGGEAIGFEELAARLPEADIVAAATASPTPVLTRELVERALPDGAGRPLLVVDIALPRDVEPGVGAVENLFLYDLDDLQQVVEGNLERRREEIPAAERIIDEAVDGFAAWHAARDVAPLIRELREHAEDVRRSEVERALGMLRGLGPDEREAVEMLTRRLLNKVLHRPTVRLREAASNGRGASVVDAARYLFALERAGDTEGDEA